MGLHDCRSILKADLFAALLETEKSFIVKHSGIMYLDIGAYLFSAGDKAERFYHLISGQIRIYKKRLDDDGEDEMAQFNAGDIIGDFDFARHAEYDVYAAATEDSVLIVFPGDGYVMDALAEKSPNTILKILYRSVTMMTERITTTRKIIMNNISWVQGLQRKAYEDPGTGLWKQTFLTDEINRILTEPTAFIMLKPDRFKVLVDSRGHSAGDDAMVRIAVILRNISRRFESSRALRFKSNETGLLIAKCNADQAKAAADELAQVISALAPVPAAETYPAFSFTGTIVWGIWPDDNNLWNDFFNGIYDLLLDTAKKGGNSLLRYNQNKMKPAAETAR